MTAHFPPNNLNCTGKRLQTFQTLQVWKCTGSDLEVNVPIQTLISRKVALQSKNKNKTSRWFIMLLRKLLNIADQGQQLVAEWPAA